MIAIKETLEKSTVLITLISPLTDHKTTKLTISHEHISPSVRIRIRFLAFSRNGLSFPAIFATRIIILPPCDQKKERECILVTNVPREMPKRHWPCFREWLRKPEFRFTAMSPIYIWRGQAALIICVRYCRSMDHSRPPKPLWKPLSLENFWTTTIGTWLMFSCRHLTIQFGEYGWMRKVLGN